MAKIKLSNCDEHVIVDDEFYTYLSQYDWFVGIPEDGEPEVGRIVKDHKTGKESWLSMANEVLAMDDAAKRSSQN